MTFAAVVAPRVPHVRLTVLRAARAHGAFAMRSLGTAVLVLACVFGTSTVRAESIVGSPHEADVQRLIAVYTAQDEDQVEEANVQLRWAGLTDRRLYDVLLSALRAGTIESRDMRELYVEAIGYSGNPEVYAELLALPSGANVARDVRSLANDALVGHQRYIDIAREVNAGTEAAATNAELWAIRHRNGLRVADAVRVRLAARDLFLHRYGRPSLDVAAEVLRERAGAPMDDENMEDAMAFLCKALGYSGVRDYASTLAEVAARTPSEKLYDYAVAFGRKLDAAFAAPDRDF